MQVLPRVLAPLLLCVVSLFGFAQCVPCATRGASVPAVAQTARPPQPKPHANDDCLACHGDASADRPVLPTVFGASVHGQAGVACVDCHKDVATAELPHAEKLAPVLCATCHDSQAALYDKSVHAEARRAAP